MVYMLKEAFDDANDFDCIIENEQLGKFCLNKIYFLENGCNNDEFDNVISDKIGFAKKYVLLAHNNIVQHSYKSDEIKFGEQHAQDDFIGVIVGGVANIAFTCALNTLKKITSREKLTYSYFVVWECNVSEKSINNIKNEYRNTKQNKTSFISAIKVNIIKSKKDCLCDKDLLELFKKEILTNFLSLLKDNNNASKYRENIVLPLQKKFNDAYVKNRTVDILLINIDNINKKVKVRCN